VIARGDRAWTYSTVAGTFYEDQKVRALGEDARTAFLYLLVSPQRASEGFYVLPVPFAAHHLRWTASRFTKALDALRVADLAMYDETAEAVLVLRGLKYNPPKGGPSIKGALKRLDEVQDTPELFAAFLAAADKYAPDFARAIRERYGLSDGACAGPLRKRTLAHPRTR
jgi:hypothetical protein